MNDNNNDHEKRPFSGPITVSLCGQTSNGTIPLAVETDCDVSKKSNSSGITCSKCNISFSAKKNLYHHQRNFHAGDEVSIPMNKICPVCDIKVRTISDLHNHIEQSHEGINLKFEKMTFYTNTEFQKWKTEIEKKSISYFNLKGTFKNNDNITSYYECHRSSTPVVLEKSKRIRHTKSNVSIKTGKTCPAVMKVTKETINEATEIVVEYQTVHVGHKNEVGTLRLSHEERSTVAGMFHYGIPTCTILDKAQKSYSATERFSYLNRQDLNNIRRDFCLNQVSHKDDAVSVDIMVNKMMGEDYNPVLLYKPVGENLQNHPKIAADEFLLAFATEAQIELLKLYGETCIMIDSTHGTNQYDFQLTTVLVNDENHEGIPVAVLFSSRVACENFEPFFQAIKDKIPEFKTNLLLTDDTNSFCNAWQNIFQDDSKHILCAWHVLKNWNNNLKSKVKDEATRLQMKQDMEVFLHEMDKQTFETQVKNFFIKYKEETAFLKYFSDHYSYRKEKWAYCHRIQLGANTNMKLERWHRQLKYEESGGTVMKRLDRAINIVLKAISKKLIGRLIAMERGKLTSQVSLIRRKHLIGEKLDKNVYSVYEKEKEKWIISKVDGSSIFTYDIAIGDKDCQCQIKCTDCNVCIHALTCTCIDYNIRYVICKHIHFFCQNYNFSIQNNPCQEKNVDNDTDLVIVEDEDRQKRSLEKSAIINEVFKKRKTDLDDQKTSLVARLQTITNRIQALESSDDLDGVDEHVKNLEVYLQRIAFKPALPILSSEVKNAPINKAIEPQRKFKIKKKKQK